MSSSESRQRVSTGSPWEGKLGYSRAARTGNHVFVSGTTATGEDGKVIGVGDAAAQMRAALEKVVGALEQCGATAADVVRTRIFTTDIDRWEEIGTAHAEVFADIRPAMTLVGVSRLIDPDHLIEIEADAVIVG